VTRIPVFMLPALLLAAAAAFAQTQGVEPRATPAASIAVPAPVAQAPTGKADALEPQGFTYNPEGRRDPFVSMLRRGSETTQTGIRPSGLAGLGTAEVSLRGTLVSQGAFVGIVQGADSKTYIVHAGDKLADGSIRSITANTMVILQQVNDPLSRETEHEVRKLLRQTEEGK